MCCSRASYPPGIFCFFWRKSQKWNDWVKEYTYKLYQLRLDHLTKLEVFADLSTLCGNPLSSTRVSIRYYFLTICQPKRTNAHFNLHFSTSGKVEYLSSVFINHLHLGFCGLSVHILCPCVRGVFLSHFGVLFTYGPLPCFDCHIRSWRCSSCDQTVT